MSDAGYMPTSSDTVARLLGRWREGPGPAHQRLTDSLRLLILDGRLVLGASIPGERDLAAHLGVSRTTVSTAYRALIDQGYLTTRPRAKAVVRLPAKPTPVQSSAEWDDLIDLSRGAPTAPVKVLHHAYRVALEQLPRYFGDRGYDALGLPALREAVSRWYEGRGVPTSPDQILITNGAQHALSLIVHSFVSPGDQVVIDHPTYPHAISRLASGRARFVPVALTQEGWDVARLRAASAGARFTYLILDNHNPTGLTMPSAVRANLNLNCLAIVDETMADLCLDGTPATAFAFYDRRTISIGSVSKSIWGGLRIGWVRAPTETVQQLAHTRSALDLGTPYVEQIAAASLLDGLDDFLPQRLEQLREQRKRLMSGLSRNLPSWQAPVPAGGISLWATMPTALSTRLAAVAPDHGLLLAAGPRFSPVGAFERHVRLPYTLGGDVLDTATARLSNAFQALTDGRRGRHDPAPIA
ncbi:MULTISPECIES: PLP-dependent aminotransferase family protein [Actinomycetes]|uniref:MocR-like transcription factor YczR n=1 Tax=Actinomycetes TaxID=1760 RepID=UPI000B243AE4|nr:MULTISPECIES: PLP-dependent aminotransferase family protein [Actinomycetes]